MPEVAKTYRSDMALLSDDTRKVVTEEDLIVTITDTDAFSVTIELQNGESVLISRNP